MTKITVYEEVEVEVDLRDFADDDIVEELQDRGYIVCRGGVLTKEQERLLNYLYLDYVEGKNTDKSVKDVLNELYKYVPLRSV